MTAVRWLGSRAAAVRRSGLAGNDAALLRSAALGAFGVLLAAAAGVAVVGDHRVGLVLAGSVLVLGVLSIDPVIIAVVSPPSVLLLERVGGSATNLSVADLVVFLATVVCVPLVRWSKATHLKRMLQAALVYQALTLLVVVAHPFGHDVLEWFHRLVIVSGALVIGSVLAYRARCRTAVRILLAGAVVIAAVSVVYSLAHHFGVAQWGPYQKNAIGDIMWVSIVVSQINPDWVGLGRWESRIVKYSCVAGLLASHSRQGIIAVVLALLVAFFQKPGSWRRSKWLLVALVPLGIFTYTSIRTQTHVNVQFNSSAARIAQLTQSIDVWHRSPVFGNGMRFYYQPAFSNVSAAPNVFVGELAEGGIVGLTGFAATALLMFLALRRLPQTARVLALAILVGHLADGLLDIYWTGWTVSLAFLVIGMCVGEGDRLASARAPEPAPTPGTRATRALSADAAD